MDTADVTRREALGAGAGALLAGLAGCLSGGSPASQATDTPGDPPTPTAVATTPTADATASTADATTPTPSDESTSEASGTPTAEPTWRDIELSDVTTDETFTVAQFSGQPVLIEFFAVWCPVCTSQQKQMREAIAQRDELVAISLNTDPNEDANRVRDHVNEHGFEWRYAVAPSVMTHSLIERFGTIIANPPAAPVVRVCPGGDAKLLEGQGVKPPSDLLAAFEQC